MRLSLVLPVTLAALAACSIDPETLPKQAVVVTRGSDLGATDRTYIVSINGESFKISPGQTVSREIPIGKYTLVATRDEPRIDLRPFADTVILGRTSVGVAVYKDRPTVVELETGPTGPRLIRVPQQPSDR